MIRTLCTLAVATLAIALLVGCGGGVDRSDAPKGGKTRPAPTETVTPAGPGASGVSQGDADEAPPPKPGDE